MKIYQYKAIGKNGNLQKGRLEAIDPTDLKKQLGGLGFSLITYSSKTPPLSYKKIKPKMLMDLCLHLEQFENAGVSLKDSLKYLAESQTLPKLRALLKEVLRDIEAGLLFSQALAKHTMVFDPVFISLISTGEKIGSFSSVLGHLSQHLKWIDDIHAQTVKALRYPSIMGIVLIMVIVVLMTVLVPELAKFIENFGENLPHSTQFLLSFSKFMSKHISSLLSISMVLFISVRLFFKFHAKGSQWKEYILDALPFIGPLRRKMALVQFCHIFSIMFENGISIIYILETSRKYLKHKATEAALQKVEILIKEGVTLSAAFQKVAFFPPVVIQMMKIGEQTSSLHKTLFHVKNYLDTTLKRQVDHILGLLEPFIIIILGCLMIWLICSIILPLYDTFSSLD